MALAALVSLPVAAAPPYYLVIGSFRDPGNAERRAARYEAFQPVVVPAEVGGRRHYRVVATFASEGKLVAAVRWFGAAGVPDAWPAKICGDVPPGTRCLPGSPALAAVRAPAEPAATIILKPPPPAPIREIAETAQPAAAAPGEGEIRAYMALRAGGAFFTQADAVKELELLTPSGEALGSGTFGVDFGRHWGAELAIEFVETNLENPTEGKIAEYAMWTLIPQVRYRYPLGGDRLVPYAIAGVGLGIGETNDRNVAKLGFPLTGGGMKTSFVGTFGVGFDYFIRHNIALGAEVKHLFLFNTDIAVGGAPQRLHLDALYWSLGLRVYFDDEHSEAAKRAGATGRAADSDRIRGYLALRTGGAFFPQSAANSLLQISAPSGLGTGAVSMGVNLGKYWGLEIAGDAFETELEAPGFGGVAEYSMWTGLAQVRLRYPILADRLVPYVVLGAGIAFGEINDKKVPPAVFPLTGGRDTSFVGAWGMGLERFVSENVALGIEAKHIFAFKNEVKIGGTPTDLTLDTVIVTGGLRVYFP